MQQINQYIMESISGKQLGAILEREGITQAEFSRLIGANRQSVNAWIKGRWNIGKGWQLNIIRYFKDNDIDTE